MIVQWYLTRYARLTNGQFELISYVSMKSLEQAQCRAKVTLPDNEFYKVEHKVGSLIKPPIKCWVARDKYSHNQVTAQMQVSAEIKAHKILSMLESADFDIKSIFTDMQLIKPLLTQAQYQLLLNTLIATPNAMKILYEGV